MEKKESQENMITVKDIIAEFLYLNGYDGLYDDEGCCCKKDHLFFSINDQGCVKKEFCNPGYKTKCPCGEHEFHIGPKEDTNEKND